MNRIASAVCAAGLAGLVALPTFAESQQADVRDPSMRYQIEVVDFVAPVSTRQVEPYYSLRLQHAGIQGQVVLTGQVDAEGRVSDLTVREGHPKLRRAARKAIERWEFQPAQANGRAIAVDLTVRVKFVLEDESGVRRPASRSTLASVSFSRSQGSYDS